jgi:diacylglycerol kinase family enzyme
VQHRRTLERVAATRLLDARISDFAFVANIDAGFGRKIGLRRTLEVIRSTLSAGTIDLTATRAAALQEVLSRIAERHPPAVAVIGGDGTARTALQFLTPRGIPVIPLPGGSLNRLSVAVFGCRSMRSALAAMSGGEVAWLPGARIGSRRFYVASGYGDCMRLNAVREAMRAGRVGEVFRLLRRFDFALHRRDMCFEDCAATGLFGLVSVGDLDSAFGLAPRGPVPSELELASVSPNGWGDAVVIAAKALSGAWRSHRTIEVRTGSRLRVFQALGPVHALLDGEPELLPARFDISFDARAGLVYAPRGRLHRIADPREDRLVA